MANENGLLPPSDLLRDRKKGRGKAFSLADLPNPINTEIRDTSELKKLHRDWKLVPYAGTTDESGDSLRAFLASMVYLSPTHGACISSKKQLSLGKLMVRKRQDEEFTFGVDEEASAQTSAAYLEFIKAINLDGKTLKDLSGDFHEDWEETGDQFLEIVVTTTMGVKSYAFYRHRPENCKYLATKKGEQRFIAVSPIWTTEFLKKNPPNVLPVFPLWEEGKSTMRTILHRKHGKNEWYGRPPAFSAWIYEYREFQDSTYLVKTSNNNFTGQLIVEVEDDNPQQTDEDAKNAGFKNEAERVAENFTAQGDDPMSVWYTTRPFGSKPMFVHDVKPNTSQDYYKVVGEISERVIIRAHNWSKRLMEAEESSGLSSNIFMDVLKSRLPVIYNIQENATAILNKALRAVSFLEGKTEFESLGIAFVSPYQEILDQMGENADAIEKQPEQ